MCTLATHKILLSQKKTIIKRAKSYEKRIFYEDIGDNYRIYIHNLSSWEIIIFHIYIHLRAEVKENFT